MKPSHIKKKNTINPTLTAFKGKWRLYITGERGERREEKMDKRKEKPKRKNSQSRRESKNAEKALGKEDKFRERKIDTEENKGQRIIFIEIEREKKTTFYRSVFTKHFT